MTCRPTPLRRRARGAMIAVAVTLLAQRPAAAQTAAPVVDSIVVITHNVFDSVATRRNVLFRWANAVRFTTRPSVVKRELLFHAGEAYDEARVAESVRNLRNLGLFRRVAVDTVREGGRLVARVETWDGWTTSLNVNGHLTGGTLTFSGGLTERNFLGTGNGVGAGYRSEPDRTSTDFSLFMPRVGPTPLELSGQYHNLSDGRRGEWSFGVPFRALSDRASADLVGEAAHQRILQFRHEMVNGADSLITTTYQRRALVNGVTAGAAVTAGPQGFVRMGVAGVIRREEFIAAADTLNVVPDSTWGAAGVFVDWDRSRFDVVTHYNGFAREEDVDLSSRLTAVGWAAPTAFGYARGGVGAELRGQTGAIAGPLLARITGQADGLFTSAGLDSGQVVGTLTLAARVLPRETTMLFVTAGAQQAPTPGHEFDLGNGNGPRAFGTHAFNGTRMVWGTLEHRLYLVDEVLRVIGIGAAGFVDYGGAWYPDQAARLGGDVGVGLRIGPTRSTRANLGRFDVAYRFGADAVGHRWVFSVGRALAF